MPQLSCWSCGRQIYTVAPLEALFAEERRCPRCGAFLQKDRREAERRVMHRRLNPPHDPGPPKPKGRGRARVKSVAERRIEDRRTTRRRGGGPVWAGTGPGG
jgi:DNA-directed RNA polymerase subunit RPC12/RpoP